MKYLLILIPLCLVQAGLIAAFCADLAVDRSHSHRAEREIAAQKELITQLHLASDALKLEVEASERLVQSLENEVAAATRETAAQKDKCDALEDLSKTQLEMIQKLQLKP